MKQENKIIGVAIDKELLKKIDEGNYNRSKLINELLTKHYEEKKLKNNS
jgi:metal-responsive CopG/Arc/MetJ family transcriptional regulator